MLLLQRGTNVLLCFFTRVLQDFEGSNMYLQYEVKSSCPLCYCFFCLLLLAVIIVALLFSSPFLLLVCHSVALWSSDYFPVTAFCIEFVWRRPGIYSSVHWNQFILQNKLKIITNKTFQHNQNFLMCDNSSSINGRQFFSLSQWLHIICNCTGISLHYLSMVHWILTQMKITDDHDMLCQRYL